VSDEIVRKLTVTATAEGVAGTTAAVNQLADSITNVAEVTDTSAKRQASASQSYDKQTRSVVDGAAAHAKYESAVKVASSALQQGVINSDQYNERLKLLKTKYLEAGEGSTAFAKVTEQINDKLKEFAGNSGQIGSVITSFGAGGLVAAAGIGALYEVFAKLNEAASEQGKWARQLSQTAETLQVTTTQLQGLNEVASEAGLSADSFTVGLFRMQQQIAQLKQGGGTLFDQLTKGNQELRNQLSVTKDTSEQINILAKAYANANEEQRKLILSGFGRNGQGQAFGRVLDAINEGGGVGGAVSANARDVISDDQIKKWNELSKAIASATESANHNFASIFTTQVLESQKEWADRWLEISRYAKEFSLSTDLKEWLHWIPTEQWLKALDLMAHAIPGLGLAIDAYRGVKSIKPGSLATPDDSYRPDFDSTFKSNFNPSGLKQGNTTPNLNVQAADAARLVTQLGAAATAQEKYNAAVAKAAAQRESGEITADTQARIINNAALERATALQAARTSALGGAATIEDAYNAKLLQLQKLQQQGAGLSKEQIDNQLRLTVAQSSGTAQIDAATAAENVKIATVGMSAQAALAYSTALAEINKQLAAGRSLTDINVEGIKASADAYAEAATKAKQLQGAQDVLRSSAISFTQDLISGLRQGKSLMESAQAAAKNLSNALMNGAITNLFNGNFAVAAVEGIASIAAGIFGDDSDEKAQQAAAAKHAQEVADGQKRAAQYTMDLQLAKIDQATVVGQLKAFDLQAQREREDEAANGNYAIIELEKKLAAERQAIIEKANKAISKSLNDFLNSVKTGNLSILSPEDQLKFAQSKFNSDYKAAQGGDEDAIGRITADAQSLLDIAKSFYASTTGYTAIYQSVTDAVSSLANKSNPLGLTSPTVSVASQDDKERKFGLANVGYSSGGLVQNGLKGIDSVFALVAGGEHITKTSSVNADTLPVLSYINRFGQPPQQGGANANGEIVRVLTQGFNGQTTALLEAITALGDRVRRVEDATRQGQTQRRAPGTQKGA
jgi:hypothetical protein